MAKNAGGCEIRAAFVRCKNQMVEIESEKNETDIFSRHAFRPLRALLGAIIIWRHHRPIDPTATVSPSRQGQMANSTTAAVLPNGVCTATELLGSISSLTEFLSTLSALGDLLSLAASMVTAASVWAFSSRASHNTIVEGRRRLLQEADVQIDVAFATNLFGSLLYIPKQGITISRNHQMQGETYMSLNVEDLAQIFSGGYGFGAAAWHKLCRNDFMMFLEGIRPMVHILSGTEGNLGATGPLDPALSRFRLSMRAFADFVRVPSGEEEYSLCSDDMREWIVAAYNDKDHQADHGGITEWDLLNRALAHIGERPIVATPAVPIPGEAAPSDSTDS